MTPNFCGNETSADNIFLFCSEDQCALHAGFAKGKTAKAQIVKFCWVTLEHACTIKSGLWSKGKPKDDQLALGMHIRKYHIAVDQQLPNVDSIRYLQGHQADFDSKFIRRV